MPGKSNKNKRIKYKSPRRALILSNHDNGYIPEKRQRE